MGHVQQDREQLRAEIFDDVKNLYLGNPQDIHFRHYADYAEFEDPITFAKGLPAIKSNFLSMPKVFAKIVNVSSTLLPEDPADKDLVQIQLVQRYTVPVFHKEIELPELVLLRMQNNEIVRHEDRWHNKPLSKADNSKMGSIYEFFRMGNAKLVELMLPASNPKI